MVFWMNALLLTFVAQALTLPTFDSDVEPSQTSVSLGVLLIWIGASHVSIFVCGRNWSRLALRMYMKKVHPHILARYRHWDMEKEVFGERDLPNLIFTTFWVIATILFSVWFILPATTPIEMEPTTTVLTLGVFLWAPIYWSLADYQDGEKRRGKLDSLGHSYHARFSVSEILSMYECLRLAPPVFWHEYETLPDAQINRRTNDEFRKMTSSYHVLGSQIHQRIALFIAVVAVVAATPSLAFLFLEGTITQWVRDLFTTAASP